MRGVMKMYAWIKINDRAVATAAGALIVVSGVVGGAGF